MRFMIFVGLWLAATAVLATGPDRASLLAAWETQQRADRHTRHFEPLEASGHYRFATDLFPFDGTLQVLETVIDDRSADHALGGLLIGQVAVDLVGTDEAFERRHATSLGLWQSSHVLYWDEADQAWISPQAWSQKQSAEYAGERPRCGDGWMGSAFWIGLLVIVAVTLWWVSRRASRQMQEAMQHQNTALSQQETALARQQEALALARESTQLLREIRDRLARQPDGEDR